VGKPILVTTPEALAQRVPPRSFWGGAQFHIKLADSLATDELERFLLRAGYVLDERVDEAGEAAIRGAVIDLYPAASPNPVRLDHADGQVTGLRCYDPASQRTLSEQTELLLLPTSEVVLPQSDELPERFAGIEHWLPEYYDGIDTLGAYLPGAALVVEDGAEERYEQFWEQVSDAYETRRSMPRGSGMRPALGPERLYLDPGNGVASLMQ
jgi:transcription-repair coupling factor (superfamily II helicase)